MTKQGRTRLQMCKPLFGTRGLHFYLHLLLPCFFCWRGSEPPATPRAAALSLVMFSLDTSYQ